MIPLLVDAICILSAAVSCGGFVPIVPQRVGRVQGWSSSSHHSRMVPGLKRRPNILALHSSKGPYWGGEGYGADDDFGDIDDEEEDDEDAPDIDLSEQDWRTFRAKLVMGENAEAGKSPSSATPSSSTATSNASSGPEDSSDLDGIGSLFADASPATSEGGVGDAPLQGMTPLDPSQWAYESGKVIEQGAVILGGLEQDFGFGLRQQYFHKAAILVLDHDDTFTKGIILNRPTDMVLEDDVNEGVEWRVWFGGDVQGLGTPLPEIVCLHSLKNSRATKASRPVMKDIQWTSFANAKKLVRAGVAAPSDFWVFCGYAGWGPQQLMGELDRKSWYMVATDSQTLLKELARLSSGADPRDAGLDTYTLLMSMIGRGAVAEKHAGGFDDLMLKEWAVKNLLSAEGGGGAGKRSLVVEGITSARQLLKIDTGDLLPDRVSVSAADEPVKVGTLLRASAIERSPFLLRDQHLHKSVVLVIADEEHVSVGVVLNRPSAQPKQILLGDDGGQRKSQTIALANRFGGLFAVKGAQSCLWLHNCPTLRVSGIGSPVGPREKGIWKCTDADVVAAISQGLAAPTDFLAVSGVCAWPKFADIAGGIQGEVRAGNFEVVPEWKTAQVWESLLTQDVLTRTNLPENLGLEAWSAGAPATRATGKTNGERAGTPVGGLGEGYDEEDDGFVFNSDVKVSKLCDDALRTWMSTFLLPPPSFGT